MVRQQPEPNHVCSPTSSRRRSVPAMVTFLAACLFCHLSPGASSRIATDQQSGLYTLTLVAGWNLISLPVTPDDSACTAVFGNAVPPDCVLRYNPSTGDYEPVAAVEPLVGYWVYAHADTQVSMPGTILTQPTVALTAGWNLFGPCSPTTLSIARELSITFWYWDGSQQCYLTVDGDLDHGVGYWLSYTGAGEQLTLGNPSQDTDAEGLWDVWERACNADHREQDTDGDTLSDYDEVFTHQTDPGNSDTDNDGLPDNWEVAHATDGLDPLEDDTDGNGVPDGEDDWDSDGLSTARELALGLDPHHADTGDAVIEFAAVNTVVSETDGSATVSVTLSALPPYGNTVRAVVEPVGGTATQGADYSCTSAIELEFGLRQTEQSFTVQILADAELEPTEVAVFQLVEVIGGATGEQQEHRLVIEDALGTAQDTDDDGLPDDWEQRYFSSLTYDADDDPDQDEVSNLREYLLGRHPNAPLRYDDNDDLKLRLTGVVH